MRGMGALAGAFAIIGTGVAFAQDPTPPARTPEQIVCELSGDCGDTAPDKSKQLDRGKEASFSFRPVATAPAGVAQPARPMAQAASPMQRVSYTQPIQKLRPRSANGIDAAITFDNGSAAMTDAGRSNAQALAIALRSPKFEGHHFMIEGHTNSIGTRDANMKLSQDRAETVAAFLKDQGVDPARIEPKGYGFDKPLANMAPTAAANRRVQVVPVS